MQHMQVHIDKIQEKFKCVEFGKILNLLKKLN